MFLGVERACRPDVSSKVNLTSASRDSGPEGLSGTMMLAGWASRCATASGPEMLNFLEATIDALNWLLGPFRSCSGP
jgi:hypothetical protein